MASVVIALIELWCLFKLQVNGSAVSNVFGASLYWQLALNAGCHPFLWVNTRADHAFFHESHFEGGKDPFRQQPSAEDVAAGRQWEHGAHKLLKRPWWYQVGSVVGRTSGVRVRRLSQARHSKARQYTARLGKDSRRA